MVKRGIKIIVFCLFLYFCLMPYAAFAASTTEAKEPISTNEECSLSVFYGYDGIFFENQSVALYKIADVSADFQYTLTAAFAEFGLIINGVQTQGEWNIIRSTLEAQILAKNIAPTKTVKTTDDGKAFFANLTPGLYLVSAVDTVYREQTYRFDSALVSLPGLGTDDKWQYQVSVSAKPTVLPPIEPEETIDLKVVKLWRGDKNGSDRPRSIEVEIFRNGISYETVILSEENNWSYNWSAEKDGAVWKVVERSIPNGYTMTVEERETSFTLTNTLTSIPPIDPPQTGDTSNILLYIVLMIVSGSVLIIIGITGKRNAYEKAR